MGVCIDCVHALKWVESRSRRAEGNLVCSNEDSPAFHVAAEYSCPLFSPQPEEADHEEPFPEEVTVANQFRQEKKFEADWADLAQPNFD